ncbi:MAG: metallophosphoesterase [Planctomycetota bacterium]
MTTPEPTPLRIGLVTDIHYADTPANEKRDTRASIGRVRQAVDDFHRHDVDVVVCLGDLIHSGPDIESECSFMRTVVAELRRVDRPIYFCLGNHCVDRLTKKEALEIIGQPGATFDATHQGVRLLGLDTCFNPDGSPYGRMNSDWRQAVLPLTELETLKQTLSKYPVPTILFTHHRLDGDDDWSLRNAEEIRTGLAANTNLLAVLQGHAHYATAQTVSGQTYVTLAPMVSAEASTNAYAVLVIGSRTRPFLHGFGVQPSQEL